MTTSHTRHALVTSLVVSVLWAVSPVTAQQLAPPPLGSTPTAPPSGLAEPPRRSAFPAPPPAAGGVLVETPATAAFQPPPSSPLPAVQADSAVVPAAAEAVEEKAAIKQADIDARIKQVNEATDLDEATKAEALQRLKGATEWLNTATEAEAKKRECLGETERAPVELAEVKASLNTPLGEPQTDVPPGTTISQIEQLVADLETKLEQARQVLAKREETVKRRNDRKGELPKLIAEVPARLEEAKKELAKAGDGTSLVDAARRLENQTRLLAVERQQQLYPIEAKRVEVTSELVTLRRDLAKRDVTHLEKAVGQWQKVLADFRKIESDRQAAEARRQVQEAHPALKSLAERNADLAERRKALVTSIEKIGSEVQQAKQRADQVKGDFEKLVQKVEKVGHSTTIGLLLRRQRDHLPDVTTCQNRLRFVRDETPQINLALLEFQDERELLSDEESAVAAVVARLNPSIQQFSEEYVRQMVSDLLKARQALLDKLIRDHDEYLKLLSELELSQQELIDYTHNAMTFIDERVLWIRSSERLGKADLVQAGSGVAELIVPAGWFNSARALQQHSIERPFISFLSLAALIVMLLCRRQLRRQVNRICESDAEELQRRFLPTLQATLAAALATACWPALVWLIGWQFTVTREMPDWGRAAGAGLQSTAFILWVCQFSRQLCRRGGVAERHFEFHATSLAIVRRHLTWLTLVGIPILFCVSAVGVYQDGKWSSSLGRLGFLAGMLALTTFAHAIFRLHKGVFSEPCQLAPQALFCRLQHAIYALGVGIPLALAALAALGYDYSAQRLAVRLQATVGVVLATLLLRAIVLRMLAVRRQLQLEWIAGKNQAAAVEANPAAAGQVDVAAVADEAVAEIEQTNSQVRYLLGYALAALLLVGAYSIWSDVAPALGVLDRVELWSEYVDVTEQHTDAEGVTQVMTSQKKVATTLKHAVLAALVFVLGLILAKSLPALLEVVVLERMPIDRGQRYAAEMILRYVATMASVIFACRTLGLTWSSIQWLAGAMMVGLGFGLQEIFANLVSGLIILFERPVRVGDLVTVGGTIGRVTRMQIRATTITDFDRRELIVPNKKFITDDVINWTLSDDVNRIVIEVGVAYGSDVELARRLLLKCAKQHPLILAEPAPSATFDRFADSSLNFTLRCFLPNLDRRLEVIHELHASIDQAFDEAGIEIAFPQQDLHVRSLDVPLRGLLKPDRTTEAA